MTSITDKETRENLLKTSKKEVKQIMEIAVAVKFIHEDNSCITSLCASIEACLLHGLKKSSSQFFKPISTMLLVQKISKQCESASTVLKMCDDYEKAYCNKEFLNAHKQNNSAQNISSRKLFTNSKSENKRISSNNFSPTFYKGSVCYKFLWIRLALINKLLSKIIDFIVSNANDYYNSFALIADPVDGLIFNSLLIGPCTLEYTRMKTCDHLWSDQNADELIQRHRMQSAFSSIQTNKNMSVDDSNLVPSKIFRQFSTINDGRSNLSNCSILSPKLKLGIRASLIAKRKASINALDDISNNYNKMNSTLSNSNNLKNKKAEDELAKTPQTPDSIRKHSKFDDSCKTDTKFSTPLSCNNVQKLSDQLNQCSDSPQNKTKKSTNNAKEYVESLHQNTKSQLIFGKNNVYVNQNEIELPGYLSLHLNVNGMVLKWTPNQMMNGSSSSQDDSPQLSKTKNCFWDFSMHVEINSIVYLHCHQQQGDDRTSIVLVAHDGIQYSPIIFPKGSHFLAFLTCFENGLGPNGRLYPSLLTTEETEKLLFQDRNDFVFQLVTSNNNVLVATLNEKTKIRRSSFSIFTAKKLDHEQSIIGTDSIIRETKLKSMISAIFSNLKRDASSLDILDKLNTPLSVEDSNSKTTTPTSQNTSIILDNSSNGRLILSKMENLNKTPYNHFNIETSTPTSASNLSQNQSSSLLKSDFTQVIKPVSVRNSLKCLCETMKKQILIRAFYGWLVYHRHLKTVQTHLIGLVNSDDDFDEKTKDSANKNDTFQSTNNNTCDLIDEEDTDLLELNSYLNNNKKIDSKAWELIIRLVDDKKINSQQKMLFYKIVYVNGIEIDLRKQIWPFLLEHYKFETNKKDREIKDAENVSNYTKLMSEWSKLEEIVKTREKNKRNKTTSNDVLKQDCSIENDSGIFINDTVNSSLFISPITKPSDAKLLVMKKNEELFNLLPIRKDSSNSNEVFYESNFKKSLSLNSIPDILDDKQIFKSIAKSLVDKAVMKASLIVGTYNDDQIKYLMNKKFNNSKVVYPPKTFNLSGSKSFNSLEIAAKVKTSKNMNKTNLISQNSIENQDVISCFATNMHRIDKDVTRCDRNYWYFSSDENLNKLKNIIYTYVWENLDIGYIQGMCDLVAPLLVILDNEPLVYSCFTSLMERMSSNFPHGLAMDQNFSNMRALIQIMDSDLFDHMYHRGDYTHFYFSYRWFLLDFKREFIYDDVFKIWETIWSAKYVCTEHFYLFIALALVETYRDIILDNNMDFTDIIKFFNEMAEKHDFKSIIELARNLVSQLQNLIKNKNNLSQ